MTASSDLVARLTKVEGGPFPEGSIGTCWHRNPDGPEAAARILALEADKAALVEALEQADEALSQLLDDMGEAGLCVCGAAKIEAIEAVKAARATLAKHGGNND